MLQANQSSFTDTLRRNRYVVVMYGYLRGVRENREGGDWKRRGGKGGKGGGVQRVSDNAKHGETGPCRACFPRRQ